ncbi:MAG: ABC transporter ATP-binding protein [Thermoplasmata archaeon]
MTEPLLKIEDLSVDYTVGAGTFHALRHVSFEIQPGEVVGVVGETGCGKSTLAQAIPRLIPEPPAEVTSGSITFAGTNLTQVPKWKMPMVRGTGIGMIFQEPINSLNPAYRVFDQIAESIRIRRMRDAGKAMTFVGGERKPFDYSRPGDPTAKASAENRFLPSVPPAAEEARLNRAPRQLREEVIEILRLVRINDPETILLRFPHELSGGMRQRVMIAMALSERPSLLIADEPTSALDVTIQAQVLTLMKELLDEIHTSILFISHDLGVIAEVADKVGVMYAGEIVEFGPVTEIFTEQRHPYTRSLLRSAPDRYKEDGPLPALAGSVPNLSRIPPGCAFHPRCPLAQPVCAEPPGPSLGDVTLPHRAACFFSDRVAGLP